MAQHGTDRTAAPKQRSLSAIPDKLYFRIGEVAKLCAVPAYVLRFWESEFPQLKPNKGGTGQRLYRRRDVEMALHIKTLLYDEGFTIPGARQTLKTEHRQKEPQLSLAIVEGEAAPNPKTDAKSLRRLQKEMRELLNLLSATPAKRAVHPIRPVRSAKVVTPAPSSDDLFD
ncbi:MerR family transcriptional regulator [Granulicella arctica]|uniref:DNA-binding transcriptional MerR regulator n=1 Tax=Granulicella arctica TaxID=940613 RepID=A0A7Y9PFU2_9BACT|nr:MerR family transcriptional regulator [Granulicella arctica]NYF78930.1 DNA-binding transcriptional MerR regulator [Granulicella arctica]